MDTILLVLALSPKALLPSEIAEVTGRDAQSVRKTLVALLSGGLLQRTKISPQGPSGTWVWSVSPDGARAIDPLLLWLRTESTMRVAR